ALRPDLAVGDLLAATDVVDLQGRRWPATHPLDGPFHTGRVLTCPHLIGDTQEKRRLGESTGAVAVDMEAATVAAWCQEHGVPFACLRVVSDDATTALSPELLGVLAGGKV